MTEDGRLVAGRYRLLGRLGTGGMGTVWRAEDLVLARQVAIKEVAIPPGLSEADVDTLRERTRREARSAARLRHPSAVTVYDVVEEDGRPWLVMELVEARTLAEVVRDDGPLSAPQAARVGLEVLGALQAAHERGIVHRDVKPSNVLLGGDPHSGGRVVLTDFGIATSTGDSSITSTGLLLGSPAYIAPERARGHNPGPASDLWSLGATLFTAVEGRAPYDKGEAMPTLTAVITDDREPYVAAGPLIPLLDGLLQPDPADRPSAAAAAEMLRDVAAGPQADTAAQPEPEAEWLSSRTAAIPLGAVAEQVAAADERAVADDEQAVPAEEHVTTAGERIARPAKRVAGTPRPVDQPAGSVVTGPARGRRSGLLAGGVMAALLVGAVVLGWTALTRDSTRGASTVAQDGAGGQTGAVTDSGDFGPLVTSSASAAGSTPRATSSGVPGAVPVPTGTAPSQPEASEPAPTQPTPDRSPAASATPDGDDAAAGSTPAGAVTPAAGFAPAGSTGASGSTAYRDPSGWGLQVPPGWVVSTRGDDQRQFRDPRTGRTLRVDTTSSPPADAVADWERQSRSFAARYPSYRRIRIDPVSFRGGRGAEWEFTYTGAGTPLRVLDKAFVLGGRGYALYWQVPVGDWDASQPTFRQLADSFRPG